jgi:hypothetical protein
LREVKAMPVWRVRVYVGPTGVHEIAGKIRAALPEGDVLEGTEHISVNVEAGEAGAAMHNLIVDLNKFYFGKQTFDWLARRLVKAPTWEVLRMVTPFTKARLIG